MADEVARSKATVIAFDDLMFNQCRPGETIVRYVGAGYRQHDPGVADGKRGFIDMF